MARGLSRRQLRITEAFDALCDAIADALGAAQGRRDAAVRAHAEAMAEMWLREVGIDAARADPALLGVLGNRRLAEPLGRIEADEHAAFAPWLEGGPQRLDALLAKEAPGAAGEPADRWLGTVSEADGSGRLPSLWRIGSGRIGDRPTPGFPVAVPLLDESHLQISSGHASRVSAEALVENLLLRVASSFRPGLVQLHVWDVSQFTGALPGLYPLTRTGLLTVHDPGQLPLLLEELSNRIRRVHTRILVDGHPTLQALAAAKGGRRTEPWVVAVLIGNRSALRDEDHRQLQRVARGGLACGVQLVLLDVPMTVNAPMETIRLPDDGPATTSMSGPHVQVTLDEPVPSGAIINACHRISAWHDDWRSRVVTFDDLIPETDDELGTATSSAGLTAPVAFADGEKVEIVLADQSPHAIIGGPSGSGKTNLLLTMISSLAAKYSPDEVQFYLLDFKEGVSFAQFAPGRRSQNWLPHARLVGVNINTDREFGLALLQFLADEMRSRAAAAKAHEVTKLEELREADPEGTWPRIVAVIDEFQYLFAERDSVTRAAMTLLEDVARRGRSQGIHLVLASQDISGIEAFWGRPAVFEQFVLRIALPRARRVLAQNNDAPLDLPRWHAVLNHESGIKHGNQVVRIPNATLKGSVDKLQGRVYKKYRDESGPEPRLFDGSRSPRFSDLVRDLPAGSGRPPRALLGQCIDVGRRPANVPLPDAPGRNVGVLASVGKDAVQVLGAAAGSVVGHIPRGTGEVVIAPLVAEAVDPAGWLAERASAFGHTVETVRLDGVKKGIAGVAAEVSERLEGRGTSKPIVVVLYAADAAETALGREGVDNMRKVLRHGPECGVHVLGWWRSITRLRTLLTMSASIDDLGAWVALDVQGSELPGLVPGMLFSWSPRPGRGLFFDRSQHAIPEVIMVPSLDAP